MKKALQVYIIFFFSVILSCKKESDQATNGNSQSDTAVFSILINGRDLFPGSIFAVMRIDTTTFSTPSRWFYIYATDTVETLTAGFIDTSSGECVPQKVFTVSGDSVSAYFNYVRETNTDTIPGCNMISGTFTITSSDTIHKKIWGSFQAVLIDPISGDTIKTTGNYSSFKYAVQ